MIKSPSKFISLERLKQIKHDHYRGRSGQEYSSLEVDILILTKQIKQGEKVFQAYLKQEREIYGQTLQGPNSF